MNRKRKGIAVLLALAITGGLTLLAGLGVLTQADLAVSDALYQQREASDGQIVLIGIDQKALNELGPFNQWNRDIFARAIEYLNQSEDCRPAVICLDVLFAGNTETDARLAWAAGQYDNVITACAAEFGSSLVETADGNYSLDTFSITAFDEPYPALKKAAAQGHINAMQDTDGILRHHLLYLDLPDGTRIPSLALAAAERYRQAKGASPLNLPPTNKRGFWYLPYCGVPGDFDQSISVADLLAGTIDPGYFSGKIVLIGPYVSGLQDSYMTPADHARPMYGVEIQANAIQALLWETHLREVDGRIQLAILFVLLTAALACFWRRPVKWSTALWAFFCGGWILLCLWLRTRGLLLHVLWVPAGVTVLYVGCIAFNYVQAALERQRITSTFQRYVDRKIVREILKEGTESLKLGGKKARIAVLFVDVRGFTPMSEKLDPHEVVNILNRYLTLISDCILNNGGTLDKFVGDAAMAFWGAPLPQEDFVMRAARAAMDMVEGSRALSEELLARYGRTVSFGIGIHLGDAVIGNIGSSQRMDYTAIGDTVNTAARLEANAPGGVIYISRAVADELEGRIQTTSLGGSVKLKGKAEGFEVLTLDKISDR